MVPLQELCDFHNGLWTGKKPPFVTAHVIRNTNFTSDGRIDLSDVAVLDVEERHLAKRELRQNDIIIEKSGGGPKQPVGRVVLFELEETGYSFSNFTSVIRVKPDALLDPVYLHRVLYWWYLSGVTESLQRRSTGIRNLDFNAYKSLEVPLPPLEEQQRIVAILDQAFAALDRARANAEANLVDAHELFEAAKTELLQEAGRSGRSVSFSDVVSIESSLVDPRLPENIDLPHLGAGNMVSNSDVLLNVQTAREEKLKSGKHTFEPGMVLYSKIRPYLRKAARPDFAGLCSADVYPLSPSTQLNRPGFCRHPEASD